jgi:hypothetical protein
VDPVLQAAKLNPWGDRRFFPPGQHPANHREREILKRLEELDREVAQKELEYGVPLERGAITEALEYHRDRVAIFEEMESRAKHDYLRACS